mmetsp:Transcript_4674/g.6423  ORF Transcript_4674/g.6423 Transcript_4674/m.6423 type:complete len:159 (-) Transcript_4674:252-728(-)|eukprot:CAMPEP_0117759564 /NCGR_PEP_ID=MMETSP0947-20121206/16090_1 /TAXON_ID=44440 /ORGANISM="Chattonella subsalsa, Strain CCMP2191" /LENGTH=158 /DNA_ID=CAMNT_0005580049 /DNA_START=160 /DNA_END=636 /DNA_ORIENTATION=-
MKTLGTSANLVLLIISLLNVQAFLLGSPRQFSHHSHSLLVHQISSEELYESAKACAESECNIEFVEELQKGLKRKRYDLIDELSKVSSLIDSLRDINEPNQLEKTLLAISEMFQQSPNNAATERAFPKNAIPEDDEDFWEKDSKWKEYYTRIEDQTKI